MAARDQAPKFFMTDDRKLFSRTYFVLALVLGVGPLAVDTSLPAMGDMAAGLGVSMGPIQATLSAFFVGVAIGQLAWGTLADRFGRRPMLLIGLGAYAGAAVGLATATTLEPVIALRFVQGFGSAAVAVMSRAVVRDLFDTTVAARMYARMFQTIGLFAVICPVVGGQLTELFGWRAVYVFMAAWSVVGMIVIAYALRETIASPDHSALHFSRIFGSSIDLLGDATFRGYLVLGVGGYVGLFALLAGMPMVVTTYLGESPAVFGYLYSAVMIVYLAATMLGERLVRRTGIETMSALGVATVALAAVLTLTAHLTGTVTLATVFAVNATVMIGFAFTMPAATAGALGNFQHMAGRATALMGFLQQAVGAVTVFMIGLAADGTPRPHTIAMACAGLIAVGAYVLLVRPLHAKEI